MPRFAENIPNVTVTLGKDALLACVVENLRGYKVGRKHIYFAHCATRLFPFGEGLLLKSANYARRQLISQPLCSHAATKRPIGHFSCWFAPPGSKDYPFLPVCVCPLVSFAASNNNNSKKNASAKKQSSCGSKRLLPL
jgi:hypothetical protein